jgi:cell division protein FtsQ
MKKALVVIGLLLLAGYLVFAAFYFEDKPKEEVCTDFEVVAYDSGDDVFVDVKDIAKYVKEKGLDPVGIPLKDVNTSNIEEGILTNQLISKAVVYITNNGKVIAEIHERKPILRVINNAGENYYIDNTGERMPLSRRFTAYLPVATGAIKEDFAKGELYNFTLFLSKDKFWNAQIEQIVVLPNGEVQLIPRVGDQVILLGKLDDYEKKLDKLMAFYQNGLNKTGWNKYSVINLKFDKQVVCTKR